MTSKKTYSSPKITFDCNYAYNAVPAAMAVAAAAAGLPAALAAAASVGLNHIASRTQKTAGEMYLPSIPYLDPVEVAAVN